MTPDFLPGYSYDLRARRYRNLKSGKFVKRIEILHMMADVSGRAQERMGKLSMAYHEKRLSAGFYLEAMTVELTNLSYQNWALGAGGFDRITDEDVIVIERRLRDDVNRMVELVMQIIIKGIAIITIAALLNRVRMWVGSARVNFFLGERINKKSNDASAITIERRLLSISEHCADCVAYYEQGWQVAGTFPPPGEGSRCMTNCRCTMDTMDVPADELDNWLGTHR